MSFSSSPTILRRGLVRRPSTEDSRFCPYTISVKPHSQLVNHRVALYKRADESILEKPNPYDDGQGWICIDDGVLEPVWSCDAALPKSLVDLWDTGDREEEEEEEEENEEGRV